MLDEAPLSARPLREVVAQLPTLLVSEHATAFLVRDDGNVRKLEFFYGAHLPIGIRTAYARWLEHAPRQFASYDPARPDPRQRNLALRSRDVAAVSGIDRPPITRSFLPKFALSEDDQLRALICDGPSLLAWVGALRTRPFARVEQRLLGAIVPALQRRLLLERRMTEAHEQASEIGSALEHVPAAAFVLGRGGAILHANVAGRCLLDRDHAETGKRLQAALRGEEPGAQIARVSSDAGLHLAILSTPGDPAPLVAVARLRWRLTPRQSQVLHLVARGLSNRTVAASLQCAESTVELHVTALLEKSQCESRAHLVARLWGGG